MSKEMLQRRNRDIIFPVDDIFDLFGRVTGSASFNNNYTPSIDISETGNDYLVEVDVPGYKSEEINLETESNSLILSIKTDESQESNVKSYISKERRKYAFFSRRIGLPKNADTSMIDASLEDGVLKVKIPKLSSQQPKKIVINKN